MKFQQGPHGLMCRKILLVPSHGVANIFVTGKNIMYTAWQLKAAITWQINEQACFVRKYQPYADFNCRFHISISVYDCLITWNNICDVSYSAGPHHCYVGHCQSLPSSFWKPHRFLFLFFRLILKTSYSHENAPFRLHFDRINCLKAELIISSGEHYCGRCCLKAAWSSGRWGEKRTTIADC